MSYTLFIRCPSDINGYQSQIDDESQAGSSTIPLSSTGALPVLYYTPAPGEVAEAELPHLDGETLEDDDESDSLPIRLLTNFTVYNVSDRRRLVPFDASIGSDKGQFFAASGSAQPWRKDEDDSSSSDASTEEDCDMVQLRLSRIHEVNVHCVEEAKRFHLDPYVYYCQGFRQH